MNGAKRVDNSFWLCERSKQVIAEEFISREEIQLNMIAAAFMNEQLRYEAECQIKMFEMWKVFQNPAKNESIKKRIMRRFFPWKKNKR